MAEMQWKQAEAAADAAEDAVKDVAQEGAQGLEAGEGAEAAEAAERDSAAAEDELPSLGERVGHTMRMLRREPAKRELYYAGLLAVHEAGEAGVARFDLQAAMKAVPQSATMYESLGALVDTLVRHDALCEQLPEPEFDEDTQEETVDMAKARYFATEVGEGVFEQLRPATRLERLFAENPEHAGAFRRTLEFCAQGKQAKRDIDGMLDDYCRSIPNDLHVAAQAIYPSYFVDRLAQCGALAWQDGWFTTQEGRAFLDEQ